MRGARACCPLFPAFSELCLARFSTSKGTNWRRLDKERLSPDCRLTKKTIGNRRYFLSSVTIATGKTSYPVKPPCQSGIGFPADVLWVGSQRQPFLEP